MFPFALFLLLAGAAQASDKPERPDERASQARNCAHQLDLSFVLLPDDSRANLSWNVATGELRLLNTTTQATVVFSLDAFARANFGMGIREAGAEYMGREPAANEPLITGYGIGRHNASKRELILLGIIGGEELLIDPETGRELGRDGLLALAASKKEFAFPSGKVLYVMVEDGEPLMCFTKMCREDFAQLQTLARASNPLLWGWNDALRGSALTAKLSWRDLTLSKSYRQEYTDPEAETLRVAARDKFVRSILKEGMDTGNSSRLGELEDWELRRVWYLSAFKNAPFTRQVLDALVQRGLIEAMGLDMDAIQAVLNRLESEG